MSAMKFKLTLEVDEFYGGLATLSDGIQEVSVIASYPEDLGTLVGPMLSLLWGISEDSCSWRDDPGEYRWLFSRQDEKLSIHVLWFKKYMSHLDNNRGETVLQMECDLFTFAKRLAQQLSQLYYQKDPSAPLPPGLQDFQAAIKAYEQAKREQQKGSPQKGKSK